MQLEKLKRMLTVVLFEWALTLFKLKKVSLRWQNMQTH